MVHIKEHPDGLELRSTSWYEIDAKMQEILKKNKEEKWHAEPVGDLTDPRNNLVQKIIDSPATGYEFVEDHIEIIKDKWTGDFAAEHVITLRRIGIDKVEKKEDNSDIRNRVVDHPKGVGADLIPE